MDRTLTRRITSFNMVTRTIYDNMTQAQVGIVESTSDDGETWCMTNDFVYITCGEHIFTYEEILSNDVALRTMLSWAVDDFVDAEAEYHNIA